MTDEMVVDSTTTTEVTATGETAETSAGTENTETTADPQANMVPSYRLKQEADKRRDAEAETERLREQLAAKEDAPAAPAEEYDDERKRVREMIWKDAEELIQERLGMSLNDVKQQLSTAGSVSRNAALQQWQGGCEKHGLDWKNEEVQGMAQALVKGSGKTLAQALEATAKVYGKQPGSNGAEVSGNVATVTDEGVSGAMAGEGRLPANKTEAQEMARLGQRAKHISSQDIFTEARKASKAEVRRI